MKRGAWINLALFVAVVALGAFVYFKPQPKTPAFALSAIKAEDVNAFRIENAGAPPIALAKVNARWQLTAPIQARADDFQVARMLNILNATSDTQLSAEDLSRFDLAPNANAPRARLTISAKHATQIFDFGMFNDITRQQYVATDDQVYLVGLQYGTALPKDAYQLVDKNIFADDETPVAFTFSNFKLEQNAGAWRLTPQASDYSQDDFNRWVADWQHAAALAVLPRTAAKNKPLQTIQIALKDQKTVTLRVLQTKPALLIARDDAPALIYQFSPELADRLLVPPTK